MIELLKQLVISLSALIISLNAYIEIPFGAPFTDRDILIGQIQTQKQIGEKLMNFKWNDGMEGEDIIIISDKKDYYGFGGNWVYFMATNVSKQDQLVDLKFIFGNEWDIKRIQKFLRNENQLIPARKYPFYDLGNNDIRENYTLPEHWENMAVWENMSLVGEGIGFAIQSGETLYFRADIRYPQNGGEFIIEAVGNKGSIGKLDPNAWNGVDSFDSYADGDLNGNNGGTGWSGAWSANVKYDIQGTVTCDSSTKAVNLNTTDVVGHASRSITDNPASGIIYWCMRSAYISENETPKIVLWDGAAGITAVIFTNLNVKLDATDIGDYTANVFNHCAFEWDDAAQPNKLRARCTEGSSWGEWSSWVATAAFTQINKISLHIGSQQDVRNVYWDEFTGTDPFPAEEAPAGGGWIDNDIIFFE